ATRTPPPVVGVGTVQAARKPAAVKPHVSAWPRACTLASGAMASTSPAAAASWRKRSSSCAERTSRRSTSTLPFLRTRAVSRWVDDALTPQMLAGAAVVVVVELVVGLAVGGVGAVGAGGGAAGGRQAAAASAVPTTAAKKRPALPRLLRNEVLLDE